VCGFESRRGHGCLSLEIVVDYQVEVYATARSLFQRSSTECGVLEFDRGTSTIRMSWPTGVVKPLKNLFLTIRNISPFSCVRDRTQACDVTARSTVARLIKLHRRFTKIDNKFVSLVVISKICLLIFFSYEQ
jgi:hypothetical protein